ncbi:DNA polymerase III subunit delta [Salisaeta longa]|uniref:DNA polymerase III subunit delta n=1 Tax=Salisaeta longa TaxID=503170 RepID=UPI0003B421D7|nr:DNA polymerase III subunit delta [Salisaeta longa]
MAKNTGASYDDLATAFRHQNFDPLYFFYGDEGYLIERLQELLIEHALPPAQHDFNLDIVYGSDATPAQLLALCQGYPVMAERRVVVVREFEQVGTGLSSTNRDQFKERFKAYAQHPNPHAVVLLACTKRPNLSAHPYRALKKHATWAEFRSLYDREVPQWIQRFVRDEGREISPQALQMLADYVGNDLQAMASEVEKLVTYAGDRTRITDDDVLTASGQTREANVFDLQSQVGEGKLRAAHATADRMLQQANNPRGEALKIVAILSAYIDKLWKLQADDAPTSKYDVAKYIGVPPYFAPEYVQAARRYSYRAIERSYRALLAADYELKGGSSHDPKLILALLLRQLIPDAPRTRSRAKSASRGG